MSKLRVVALFLSCAVVTVLGYQSSPENRPWPPGVQKVSDQSPALSPEDELKTFYMPPGYHLDLVASEPLVQDPIAMDWDAEGRLWVVEFPEYVRSLDAPEPNLDPIGKIVVLEDTDHDGKMDKRTVFADGLVQARAVKATDHGILVLEPPNLWLMHDTNGDLKMAKKELVATDYGRRDAGVEGNANGLFWGLDNWIHSSGGNLNFSVRLKDGRFDKTPSIGHGEWGITQDDAGRMYRNSSESALHVDLVASPYYARNPDLLRTRGSYEALTSEKGNINEVWPVRPNPGTNRAYQAGIDKPDGTLAQYTATCTPLVYRGDRLPAELYGNVFIAEPSSNFVSRIILSDDGKTIRGHKAYEGAEFLASTDERFRPVFMTNAPDGTIYIADFYRGILQDRASTTLYLRDYIQKKNLDGPINKGRIFRVMHDTTKRDTTPALGKATPAQLVQALSSPNGWRRDTAQRLLVERGAKPVVPEIQTLAATSKEARTRMTALWTLDGNDNLTQPIVIKALDDADRDVRVTALRLSERWLSTPNSPVQAAVLKKLDDTDWAVTEQLAATLGALPTGPRETGLVSLLDKHGDDPVVMDVALSGVHGHETELIEKLMQSATTTTTNRESAITMLVAMIVRAAETPTLPASQQVALRASINTVLTWAADTTRPNWQRAALLHGAEVALLNAAMPGNPGRRGGGGGGAATQAGATPVPCPTCPGGRAGPGGAYAFPEVMAAQNAVNAATRPGAGTTVARGRSGGPHLTLAAEPATLAAIATGGGQLGPRATALLDRIDWPGKAGGPAPLAPLTAAQQKLYDGGAEVYKNICQACHQPDGRGQEHLAPSLVGSVLALASPDIPARILLNGKEGPIGLMPPIGSTLTDDQVAGVLTYVRRMWGQTGTPVDPSVIKTMRAQTASRTAPWTNDELLKMVPAAGGGRGQ